MKHFRGIIGLVLALSVSPAMAQTNQGISPYSVPKGGTGKATLTNHGVLFGQGTAPIVASAAMSDGQLLVGQTGADPLPKTIAGDVTVNSSGVTAIGTAKVTLAMMADATALSVLGRASNTSGVPAYIAAANDGEVLRRSGAAIGFGTIVTAGIANDAVTDAKLRNSAALSLIGRSANSSGDPADVSAVAASDCVFRESSSTVGCGAVATAGIAAAAVTYAKIQNLGALALMGRSANSSGVGADIAASAGSSCAFRESASTISCGTLATAAYAANSVTNAKLAQMANNTFKGNVSGSTADPSDLTQAQATAALNNCVGDSGSGGTKGSVPAPGAGDAAAGKFLKADCTWAVPAGGGGGGGTTDAERQNFLLSVIYQSKTFGDYRRLVGLFATGFKASTDALRGINTGSSSNIDATGALASGFIQPTASTTQVTIAPQASVSANTTQFTMVDLNTALINGVAVTHAGYSTTAALNNIKLKIVKRNSASNYDIVADTGALNHPGGGFVDFPLNYTVPGSGSYYLAAFLPGGIPAGGSGFAGSMSRAFLSTVDAVGAGVTGWTENTGDGLPLRYNHSPTPATMTVVTISQTADSTVGSGRVLLEYSDAASPTLNTDLTVEVTCNGGTNWASASLSAATAYSGTSTQRKVAESVDQSCGANSGTSFAARIKTLNNKSVPIYGASLTVH